MQRVESYGLMGTAPETVAPLSTATAAAIVAAAERIAPAPAPKRKGPTRRRVPESATGGLIRRISAAEAARDDLPPGVYVFPNGRGQTVTRCVGEANCRAYTAAMRVRALKSAGSDRLAEEIAALIRRGA